MEGQDAAKPKVHPADKTAADDAILARAHAIKVCRFPCHMHARTRPDMHAAHAAQCTLPFCVWQGGCST